MAGTSDTDDLPPQGAAASALREQRLPPTVTQRGLRRHTARGVIINSAFQVGLAALNLLRRLVVVAFLTAAEFGLWSALLATLFLVLFLKQAGIGDKFIQQSDEDQERAFQKMFTIDLILSGITMVAAAIVLPLFALAYGQPDIVVPGLVLSLAVLGSSLQSPNIVFYRQMDFVRQRILQAVDPCVAFAATIGLAAAGVGYWSLVLGAVIGSFAGAAAAIAMCPYKLRLHLPRGTVNEYFSFSWPLMAARGGVLAMGQATLLVATRAVGLAAAGAIALAMAIMQFSRGVDAIVTQTLYPGICAVRERMDLLFEAFIKSNRIALMWGVPFGIGAALFASDFVHFAIGDRWEPAIVVLQAFGVVAAMNQLGFNWAAFVRALGNTKPIAVLAAIDVVAFLGATTPLMIAYGLPGFAAGAVVAQLVTLTARMHYLKGLFPQFKPIRHALRAASPILPAVIVVALARLVEPSPRSGAMVVAELVAFVVLAAVTTALAERTLVRELRGYLRGGGGGRGLAQSPAA